MLTSCLEGIGVHRKTPAQTTTCVTGVAQTSTTYRAWQTIQVRQFRSSVRQAINDVWLAAAGSDHTLETLDLIEQGSAASFDGSVSVRIHGL